MNSEPMKTQPLKKIQPTKKLSKTDREKAVLLGLIELYLKTGKPIGSHTLQENGFGSLSSATIRNYFSKMEEAGFLTQQHTSGGRIPTEKAYRLYADTYLANGVISKEQEEAITSSFKEETKEIATLLHKASDILSDLTKCAVFISAPRFDQDFIQDVKLVLLDDARVLSVLITDFGLIHTETLYLDKSIEPALLKTAEEYFLWRLNKKEKPLFKSEEETKIAQKIYNEVMVRHVVGYANFPEEDILRTGLSKLLTYPEFNDAAALVSSLALLEDVNSMRSLLRECKKNSKVSSWIGNELCPFISKDAECSVLAIPYRIGTVIVGNIAILGPMRIPYRNLFGILQAFSNTVSKFLESTVYKYKITYREPTRTTEPVLARKQTQQIEAQ
jgi:heat-inducible transcriptional repressor